MEDLYLTFLGVGLVAIPGWIRSGLLGHFLSVYALDIIAYSLNPPYAFTFSNMFLDYMYFLKDVDIGTLVLLIYL